MQPTTTSLLPWIGAILLAIGVTTFCAAADGVAGATSGAGLVAGAAGLAFLAVAGVVITRGKFPDRHRPTGNPPGANDPPMTGAVRSLVREPLVGVGLSLLAVGAIAIQWQPPSPIPTRTELAILAGVALPGGLAVLLIGALLTRSDLRDSRIRAGDPAASHRRSVLARALRATGALTCGAVTWWVLGWLLVLWIGMAMDGWMALGCWPTAIADHRP